MKGEKPMGSRQKNFRSLCIALGLAMGLTFMIVPPASATEFLGPDEFGYIANEISSSLRDIIATGTPVSLLDDQVSAAIPLPFDFIFYGVIYRDVYISSNGFITLNPKEVHGVEGQDSVPNTVSPNNMIAGFWEDLNPEDGGTISYATVGTDGDWEFVVEFKEIPRYSYFHNGVPVTFQIILYEGSNDIELQYGSTSSDGGTHTVGIENADGTTGLQIDHGDISFDHEGFIIDNPLTLIEEFEVHSANVSFGKGQELDKYDIQGEFTLSEFSDGIIDPVAEEVTIKVGTSSLVIPANSFQEKGGKQGAEYQGSVDGALVHVSIEVVGPLTFRYHVEAHKVDLSDSPIPLKFSLKMGTDVGDTTIPLHGYLRTGKKHNYSGHKTRLKDHLSKHNYFRSYHR
jgi:hypothetical protein